MQAVIALGSNLGDRERNLALAVYHLSHLSSAVPRCSSVWRTAPVGFQQDVPQFCNAVVVLETSLSAQDLLDALKGIERKMGRDRDATAQYESRAIDLDIIDLGGQVLESERLTLPHPRACERRFVLGPLGEVLPDYRFPHRSESVEALLALAPDDVVEKTSPLPL